MQVSESKMDTTSRNCTCFTTSHANCQGASKTWDGVGPMQGLQRLSRARNYRKGRLPKRTAASNALTRRAADLPGNASCCLHWFCGDYSMNASNVHYPLQDIHAMRLAKHMCNIMTGARVQAIAKKNAHRSKGVGRGASMDFEGVFSSEACTRRTLLTHTNDYQRVSSTGAARPRGTATCAAHTHPAGSHYIPLRLAAGSKPNLSTYSICIYVFLSILRLRLLDPADSTVKAH